MNKKNNSRGILHNGFLSGGITAAILFISFLGTQSANAAITSSLDFGSTGADVTELQTYLALNASIYPSGLITGYFGPLTQAAVEKFQTAQGIVTSGTPATTGYGRVGPQTMARINTLMGSSGNAISWDTVPVMSKPVVQVSNTTATFIWNTNEPTHGQVYYDKTPLRTDEATGPNQMPYVSGMAALDEGSYQVNHTVTVQNLTPNTTYYFLARSIDTVRGMSMTWPATFHTNQ